MSASVGAPSSDPPAFTELRDDLPPRRQREQLAQEFTHAAAQVREWLEQRDLDALCQALFDASPTHGQKRIIEAIAYRDHKRLAITAHTRYGKTWSVALGIALLLVRSPDPLEVNIISATLGQAKRMRRYLAEFLLACPLLQANLLMKPKGVERLKKEVSKRRLTFKDGKEVNVHTGHGKAKAAMGEGGDVNIVDEAALIQNQTYREKIRRMAGDDPDASLIEVSNPWSRDSEFWNSWQDDLYETIQITWEQGLEEGRITSEFVHEQRRRLDPISFTILYEAAFPRDVEDALIRWDWIQHAVRAQPDPVGEVEWGADIGEHGRDKTVLVRGWCTPTRVAVESPDDVTSWGRADTMATANMIDAIKQDETEPITVDAAGVGSGVASRLEEKGHDVQRFKSSRSPIVMTPDDEETIDAANLKAEAYWHLRELFEKGAKAHEEAGISIPDHPVLLSQLARARYELKNGRVYVFFEDESEDSPDHADALCLLAVREVEPSRRDRVRSWS